jgi:hypothetical protein
MTVDETAVILKRTNRTVHNLLRRGKLTPHRFDDSKRTWINLDEIEEHLMERAGATGHPGVKTNSNRMKWLRRWHPEIFPHSSGSGNSPK